MHYEFSMEPQEYWWGGTSVDGLAAPFDRNTNLKRDFAHSAPNQTMPLYLSSLGRSIWSSHPFAVDIHDGIFHIDGDDVVLEKWGDTLQDAYCGTMKRYFPPRGNPLPPEFFKNPQYNTWMQMAYEQNQEGVMKYARGILENGFTPGILMIDEGWQMDYGVWDFDRAKFPDPESMVKQLHEMGFLVMLWVVPYVCASGKLFAKEIRKDFNPDTYDKVFLRNLNGDVAITRWWNGYSAILDFTKEWDREFLSRQLQYLIDTYGIDGFKFDGGTVTSYSNISCINGPLNEDSTAGARNIAWNDFGAQYPFHEYKDTYCGGGKRTIQRLRDRAHSWDTEGINTIIPNALLLGLLGHPFICPDMIGGGEWSFREMNRPVDEELFVRMAQCAAMFPMMQFSWAPWEAVGTESLHLIKAAEQFRLENRDYIMKLVHQAHIDGEPILRTLEYNYPHMGYHEEKNMFMLGEDLLVAPITKKEQQEISLLLPPGTWIAFDGKTYEGNHPVVIPVTLADLPHFWRQHP